MIDINEDCFKCDLFFAHILFLAHVFVYLIVVYTDIGVISVQL